MDADDKRGRVDTDTDAVIVDANGSRLVSWQANKHRMISTYAFSFSTHSALVHIQFSFGFSIGF